MEDIQKYIINNPPPNFKYLMKSSNDTMTDWVDLTVSQNNFMTCYLNLLSNGVERHWTNKKDNSPSSPLVEFINRTVNVKYVTCSHIKDIVEKNQDRALGFYSLQSGLGMSNNFPPRIVMVYGYDVLSTTPNSIAIMPSMSGGRVIMPSMSGGRYKSKSSKKSSKKRKT